MGSKNIYERFLWFDGKARAKKYPNASTLAAKFEMSAKTAQRDIEFMRDRLNCPLLYDQREKGYYYEDDTFSLPSIYISSEELSALLITRKMLQGVSAAYLGNELSQLIDKITSILEKQRIGEEIIDDAVSIQHVEHVPPPEGVFRSVLEGCFRRKRLEFSYYSPVSDERTFRQVDPYHLFNYMGTWHLVGHCHLRKGVRDFNLARITGVTVLNDTFTPGKKFDFQHYFDSAFGLYKGEQKSEVTLRFTPEKAKWIREQIWHRDQKMTVLADGSLELSFPVAGFSEITMEILKHGPGVEVLRPESLRKRVREEAEKIAKIYCRKE
jgi:predicted DNA-binding transcriptional regulator YafY